VNLDKKQSGKKGDSTLDFSQYCRDVPDFPKQGIIFRDITNLLKNGPIFKKAIDEIARHYQLNHVDKILSVEARGFLIGSALAYKLECGLVPVRKKGKLPWKVYRKSYNLEYGQDELEVHQDSLLPNQNVLIVDDVLATGGTVEAVAKLIREMKGNILGAAFLVELKDLKGRERIKEVPVYSLIKY
jgi:adenine phosphoribosyltransferase